MVLQTFLTTILTVLNDTEFLTLKLGEGTICRFRLASPRPIRHGRTLRRGLHALISDLRVLKLLLTLSSLDIIDFIYSTFLTETWFTQL
jgi:hypothetical protein